MGITQTDAEGKVIKKTESNFTPDPEGATVFVCEVDPETMKQISPGIPYGDWAASAYLREIMEKLGPGRPIDIPDLEGILTRAIQDDFDPCDYCENMVNCRDCVITQLKAQGN